MNNDNNNKNLRDSLNEEINALFEKIVASRDRGLKNVEGLKRSLTRKLDREITRLYSKKDFISDIWNKREELRRQKVSFLSKLMRNSLLTNLRFLFSMPFIYGMIVPAVLMHFMLELYHQVCFRLWHIPRVRPRDYFLFDRKNLPYLNWFEKFNCLYCSYFNCLVSYMKEISGRTERYWCPIKHSQRIKDQHSNYDKFVDYSDGQALRDKWEEIRDFTK